MLLLTVCLWGIATPIVKATVSYVPPLTFLMLRFWVSALIVLPISIYFFHKVKLNWTRLRKIITASTIGHIIALALIFIGIEKTSAVDASLMTSFSPLLIGLFGFFILREHITSKEIEGTLIAFVGTLFIVFEPIISNPGALLESRAMFIGNALFLLGLVADAFYVIYVKRNLSEDKLVSPMIQICFSFIFAAIIFTPLGFFEQFSNYNRTESGQIRTCTARDIDAYNYSSGVICDSKGCFPTQERDQYFCLNVEYKQEFTTYLHEKFMDYLEGYAPLGIIYMALFSGIIAYVAYNYALKHVEASEAAVFYYLQPVIGIPFAMIFLGETITYVYLIGAAFILGGIYMSEKRA